LVDVPFSRMQSHFAELQYTPLAGHVGTLQAPQSNIGMAPGNAGPWYVCLTKPRQEAYALGKLQEQGYELYLPQLQSWARRAGRWVQKQSVMFPRYAFVRPSRPGQGVSAIRSTPGVTTLVRFGPVLACLSHERLAALHALMAERAAAAPQQPLHAGQHVVFTSGPLRGLSGLVSDVAAERVKVLMSLLGQEQRVTGPADQLALA
jgi:transcriptional antiterminator RfaH